MRRGPAAVSDLFGFASAVSVFSGTTACRSGWPASRRCRSLRFAKSLLHSLQSFELSKEQYWHRSTRAHECDLAEHEFRPCLPPSQQPASAAGVAFPRVGIAIQLSAIRIGEFHFEPKPGRFGQARAQPAIVRYGRASKRLTRHDSRVPCFIWMILERSQATVWCDARISAKSMPQVHLNLSARLKVCINDNLQLQRTRKARKSRGQTGESVYKNVSDCRNNVFKQRLRSRIELAPGH